jgi:uncharacterized membrane protein YgcG
VTNHRFAKGLAVIALLGGALLASPGCTACPDIASKICEKACACGSDCVVGAGSTGLKTGSKAACVTAYSSQCLNQTGIDYNACSTALDTAECDDAGAVVLPTACTSAASDGGDSSSSSSSGGGGSSSSSGSSSGSM